MSLGRLEPSLQDVKGFVGSYLRFSIPQSDNIVVIQCLGYVYIWKYVFLVDLGIFLLCKYIVITANRDVVSWRSSSRLQYFNLENYSHWTLFLRFPVNPLQMYILCNRCNAVPGRWQLLISHTRLNLNALHTWVLYWKIIIHLEMKRKGNQTFCKECKWNILSGCY